MKTIKPKLIIIAGPNGSGKTSVTYKLLNHEWIIGCEYINPNIIANEKFGDWNSAESVLKAVKFAEEKRFECIKNKKDLIFETVLSSHDKIDFIEFAKEKGYFVRLFFVGTNSPIINAARIAKRVMEGGHDVPINKIISRYSKSIVNCSIALNIVDRAYVYDNSIDYRDPILLFKAVNGKIAKIYNDINPWALNIYDSYIL